jgi:hypothetical protein
MVTTRPAVLAMLVLAAGTSAPAQTPLLLAPNQDVAILQEIVATQAFEERVNQYVTLHRLLEAPLPPLRTTRDMGQLQMRVRALALWIRTARANAHHGDLIRPDVARMFRRRIATCLPPAEWAAILADNAGAAEEDDQEGVPPAPPALQVNMAWPEQVPFGFVPPQLLAALPRLPAELQYRIIGNALVLWDHHANLIVDFMPDAFTVLT